LTGTAGKALRNDDPFLLFNHRFTSDQEVDAHASLGVEATVPLPPDLQGLWSAIPPERKEINDYLGPIAG
jgi:hypothetical protein